MFSSHGLFVSHGSHLFLFLFPSSFRISSFFAFPFLLFSFVLFESFYSPLAPISPRTAQASGRRQVSWPLFILTSSRRQRVTFLELDFLFFLEDGVLLARLLRVRTLWHGSYRVLGQFPRPPVHEARAISSHYCGVLPTLFVRCLFSSCRFFLSFSYPSPSSSSYPWSYSLSSSYSLSYLPAPGK